MGEGFSRSYLREPPTSNHSFTVYARYWYSNSVSLSVCPSVRLSVTFRYSVETTQHTVIVFFSLHDSPIILFLWISNIFTKFRRVAFCGGTKCRWGITILQFSTNKSLYLANDTRYRRSCYGRRTGNRTQAFKCYQFQWRLTQISRSRIIQLQATRTIRSLSAVNTILGKVGRVASDEVILQLVFSKGVFIAT